MKKEKIAQDSFMIPSGMTSSVQNALDTFVNVQMKVSNSLICNKHFYIVDIKSLHTLQFFCLKNNETKMNDVRSCSTLNVI